MGNSFTTNDKINAREAFTAWQGGIDETVDSYILRQRKNELRQLVKTVIANELSDYDKTIVKLRWYENMTLEEIAERLKVDPSTVSRHLDRINSTIYEKLKYAVEYRYGRSFSRQSEIIIKSGDAYKCSIEPKELSERLRFLRTSQFLTIKDISKLSGIRMYRLEEIEKNGVAMTAEELKKLCVLYRCSSDYLLFGKGVS